MSIHKMLDRRMGIDAPDDEVVVLTPPDLSAMTAHQVWKYEFDQLLKRNFEGFDDREMAAKLAKLAAHPPSNNMGGPYHVPPQNFPHGEKSSEIIAQRAMIDWFGFSSCAEVEAILLGLQVLWPDMRASTSKAGMKGYPNCKALYVDEVQFGLVGYGAKHGRNSVSLTGVACKTITTNEQFECLRGLMDVLDGRLSRVDLCFDFYKGEVTFDYALRALEEGRFKADKANKDPDAKVIRSTGAFGQNTGRTLYVGPRKGEKYIRVYEKGLEVFAKMPEAYREACTERENEILEAARAAGEPVRTIADDWLRLECEFKRVDKDRPIPLDIILDRDAFFAGVCPFFAWALGLGTGRGRSRLKSDAEIEHDRLIAAHRTSYGNHIHSLRRIGFTDTEIVNLLDTGRDNQKLVKAGIVTISQQAMREIRAAGDDSDIPF